MHRAVCWGAVVVGIALIVLGATPSSEAPATASSCDRPETEQFGFWEGTWALRWEGGTGTNRVRRILGGCVVEERFEGTMADGRVLHGVSHTVYDPRAGVWRQTWVDNAGAYLDFTGGMEGDRMILSRRTMRDGQPLHQRMVFHSITADSLRWDWQSSPDGVGWDTKWTIAYVRSEM